MIRKGAFGDFRRLLGHEMHGIYLESDSQIAVTIINEGPPKNSSYRNMIEDCKSMLNKPKSSILHSLREGNRVVECLARKGIEQEAHLVTR